MSPAISEYSFVESPAFKVDKISIDHINYQPMFPLSSLSIKALQDIQAEEDYNIFQAINSAVDKEEIEAAKIDSLFCYKRKTMNAIFMLQVEE